MVAARRQYTRRQKAIAVVAAEMSNVSAASKSLKVPRTTLVQWMDRPEYVELRHKTREDQAESARTLGLRVLGEIERRIGEFEPRDLSILYGILTDKGQLLAGEATTRTESRDLTADLSDHEKDTLAEILREAITERTT